MSKIGFFNYRVKTILNSFKVLYSLPSEKLDAFLNSYNIYDHDWVNKDQLVKDMGEDYYSEVKRKLIDYYCVLNHLCSLGQIEKMYIPPAIDLSKGIIANQDLYEEKMSRDLGVFGPEKKILDIGCGRGRVAAHVASFTGSNVVGINIDSDQLESAKTFAQKKGFNEQCTFQMADLNEIPFPFPDNSFDGIYHVQVFSYSKDLKSLCKELNRILKPGGKIACLDWVRLKYDATNPEHEELMKRIKPLIGAIGTPSVDEYVDALRSGGFKVLTNENASINGLQAPLIENADRFFTRLSKLIKFLVRWKVLPRHFQALFDRLTKDGEAFVQADRMGLVTTSHYIVAQKD